MATITRFGAPWDQPFSGAASGSAEVPSVYPVGIGGHGYMLDLDHNSLGTTSAWFREASLPMLREQADTGKLPGEQSVNPAGYWRRSGESWHHGAGQSYTDRGDADDFKFNASKGVDVWTKWKASLLPSTSRTRTLASTSAGPSMVSTGTDIWATDGGQNLYHSVDGTTWNTVTGTPAANCLGLATSGGTVYSIWDASGLYSTSTSSPTTAASLATGTAKVLGYVKGRILIGNGAALINYVSGGALPAAFFTHAETTWEWRAFCAGHGFIYAAGTAGGRSAIYRITIQPDGTALTVPVVAAELPTGETVRSLFGYLGFVIIGTDKGVRLALASDTGDLTLGALIPTTSPVRALDAADRFIYFGWTNYDATSTGIGRMDLTVVSDALAPAYASDLMATAQGTVQAIAIVDSKVAFAVGADGVYIEQTTPVASGTLETGDITYGIADKKTALYVDLKHDPLPSGTSISVAVSTDSGTYNTIGTSDAVSSTSPSSPLNAGQTRGETFQLKLTLTASGSSEPTLTRWTLRSFPAPASSVEWTLPLIIADQLYTRTGAEKYMDCSSELDFLRSLNDTKQITSLQIGTNTYTGVVTDYVWLPDKESGDPHANTGAYQGRMIIQFKETS